MENDFLADSLMLYIENDIASTFSLDSIIDDSIIDDFEDLKECEFPFHRRLYKEIIVFRVSCFCW